MAPFPPPRCYPETRVEVLKTITNRIDDANPRKRIFWLNSPAGAGKTAIAQTIAERCSDRGVADRLFLTLTWQLALSIPRIYAKGGAFQPDLRPQRSLIIIDAIVECATDRDQKIILELIATKMPNGAQQVRTSYRGKHQYQHRQKCRVRPRIRRSSSSPYGQFYIHILLLSVKSVLMIILVAS